MNRLLRRLLLGIQEIPFFDSHKVRPRLLKMAGVKIEGHIHVGEHVIMDTLHPELISIGEGSAVTMGCIILTHFMHPNKDNPYRTFTTGNVKIGKNVFIGANTTICQPVTIGDNSVIAAGSVVIKDIPANEIWGGVPAHFIKKRYEAENKIL